MSALKRSFANFEIVSLILFLVAVFFYQQWLGEQEYQLLAPLAAIPARIYVGWTLLRGTRFSWELVPVFASLLTAVFLHGDAGHLLNNLLFLWLFGSLVEGLLGKILFPICFVLCGVGGNIAQVLHAPFSMIPIIGASGAITGLEGVYLVVALRWNPPWPHVWPMSRAVPPKQLAAVGAISFFLDATSMFGPASRVALAAHLGGFLTGVTIAMIVTTIVPHQRP